MHWVAALVVLVVDLTVVPSSGLDGSPLRVFSY